MFNRGVTWPDALIGLKRLHLSKVILSSCLRSLLVLSRCGGNRDGERADQKLGLA